MNERVLTAKEIKVFQRQIYRYYKFHRRDFPWRRTADPYSILVSEVMLQQTQVKRVQGKYLEFIKTFPDFEALANASQKEVLLVWQGLGYNRRALLLKKIAEKVVSQHGGELPKNLEGLSSFSGIGKTTAGAILAFAFNMQSVFIETNIRRVFIHEFFGGMEKVSDIDILPLVEATIDQKNPREWYWALMDFGSMLKRGFENPNRKSTHYTKQPAFEGSDRRIRGLVIKKLLHDGNLSAEALSKATGVSLDYLQRILQDLADEGFISRKDGLFMIV
jgi:A/G-specific adenine glycosylase